MGVRVNGGPSRDRWSVLRRAGAAAALTGASVAALEPVAVRLGAVSSVTAHRWHTHASVPRLAGPGLLLGLALATPPRQTAVLAPFCVVGVLDDLRELTPPAKAGLLLAASAAAGRTLEGDTLVLGVATWVAANAVNLLDHADGLAGGAVAASLLTAGSAEGLVAAAALAGFLAHNRPPARAFMGDGGSLLLGALLVVVRHRAGPRALALGALVPLLDAGFVVGRRLLEHRPPWVGGTDHSGHVLLRAGVPPRLLVALYAAVAAVAGAAAPRERT